MYDTFVPLQNDAFVCPLFLRHRLFAAGMKGDTFLSSMLLASHDFVDESWMGTPVDFPGIGERDTNIPSFRCMTRCKIA